MQAGVRFMVWVEVNVIKYIFTFGKAKVDLESSRAGFMRSPAVLASWRSPAGRTSGMAIVHCNLLILITYLLILITHYSLGIYLLRGKVAKSSRVGFREKSSRAGF